MELLLQELKASGVMNVGCAEVISPPTLAKSWKWSRGEPHHHCIPLHDRSFLSPDALVTS